MLDGFHEEHQRVFAVKEPEQQVECTYWRGRLTALLDAPQLRPEESRTNSKPRVRAIRQAYFSSIGKSDLPRYLGKDLHAGVVIEGPAIIDEPTTTVVVYPGSSATLTPLRNYLLEIH